MAAGGPEHHRHPALARLFRCAATGLLLLLCLLTVRAIATPQPASASPSPAVPAVTLDPRRSVGSARARVGIVEFSDLQCPFCRRFHEGTLGELKTRYIDTGKLRYSYRDFPLEGHEQALPAAVAARCAGQQGAYWPMQAALFSRQRELSPPLYPVLAAGLKIEPAAFKACLAGSREAARVRADARYGQSLQVDRTPFLFVGRLSGNRLLSPKPVAGARPFEYLRTIIDDLLRP